MIEMMEYHHILVTGFTASNYPSFFLTLTITFDHNYHYYLSKLNAHSIGIVFIQNIINYLFTGRNDLRHNNHFSHSAYVRIKQRYQLFAAVCCPSFHHDPMPSQIYATKKYRRLPNSVHLHIERLATVVLSFEKFQCYRNRTPFYMWRRRLNCLAFPRIPGK